MIGVVYQAIIITIIVLVVVVSSSVYANIFPKPKIEHDFFRFKIVNLGFIIGGVLLSPLL